MVGKSSQMAGKGYFDIGFSKYSKEFLYLYVLSTTVEALCSLQIFKDYLIL